MLTLSASVYSQSLQQYGSVATGTSVPVGPLVNPNCLLPRNDTETGLVQVKEESQVISGKLKKLRILRIVNLGLMAFCLTGYGMCLSLFAPFFPIEAEGRGISSTVVGLIFATFTFVMFIGSLVAGLLVRYMSLTFMVVAGTLLAGSCEILFGVLNTAPPSDAYVVLCFALRFVEGCGGSLYNTAAYAIAAQLYPDNIATVYAILEASNGFGKMVGPSLGGILYGLGGFSLPFYVIGSLVLVSGAISQIAMHLTVKHGEQVLPKSDNTLEVSKSSEPLPWSHLFKNSLEFWILTVGLSLSGVIFGYPQPTLSIYLADMGMTDPAQVGLVFLGGSLGFTILSVAVGKYSDRFPDRVYHVLTAGSTAMAISMIFYGPLPPIQSVLPPSIALTTSCHMLLSLGVAMIMNPIPSALLRAAKSVGFEEGLDMSAMIASIFNAQWFLGQCAGSPVAGILMDSVGFAWGAFILGIVSFIVVATFAIGICVRQPSEKLQFAYVKFYDSTSQRVDTVSNIFDSLKPSDNGKNYHEMFE